MRTWFVKNKSAVYIYSAASVFLIFLLPFNYNIDDSAVDFWVIGDTPYNKSAEITLSRYLNAVPKEVKFVIHVGDIKPSLDTSCAANTYKSVSSLLKTSSVPVFITLGDNEYNDCARPKEAFANWKSNFHLFDKNWDHDIQINYQPDREENISFLSDGVLFVGVNLVGGKIHDPQEWADRSKDALVWVKSNFARFGDNVPNAVVFGHAFPDKSRYGSFQKGFVEVAQYFKKPVLYLQGDNHKWQLDRPFSDAANITRITIRQTGVDQNSDPLHVSVSRNTNYPFTYKNSPFSFDTSLLVGP